MIYQDGIDSSFLIREDRRFMGIGCSCSRDFAYGRDDSNSDGLPQGTCIFAFAKSIRGKKVVENIPTYFPVLRGDDSSERCSDYCNLYQMPAFYSQNCHDVDKNNQPVPEIHDQNNWCKQCDEIMTHCTQCVKMEQEIE